MKILLADFNVKLRIENDLKPRIGNECLHQDSNDNDVRKDNFATSKILVVKSTMFRIETFMGTDGRPLMERPTTSLIAY